MVVTHTVVFSHRKNQLLTINEFICVVAYPLNNFGASPMNGALWCVRQIMSLYKLSKMGIYQSIPGLHLDNG